MSTITATLPTTSSGIRTAGWLCAVAGVLGAASGVFLAVVEPQVPDTRFSYPLTATAFVAIQLWFVVQHLGLMAGIQGLWMTGWTGRGGTARAGIALTQGGLGLLTIAELYAVRAAESAYPGPHTDTLDALYGVSCTAAGVGLVLLGVATLRAGRAPAAGRWLPLALGVWVFVPMFPALMAGHVPARLAITGWMLLFAALGLVLARRPAR